MMWCQLALCDAEYLKHPLRWSARVPMLWAAAENFDAMTDPLPFESAWASCAATHGNGARKVKATC
jgi:hypothetical protein